MGRKATLIGAGGLIGRSLLELLLNDSYYEDVHLLVRKSLGRTHPKLTEHLIRFDEPKDYVNAIAGAETVFCAVGTTLKKVKGDHEAYRKVDFTIPVTAAKTAAEYGVFGFSLVSSIGASASNNNNFYLKLKGITEEAVSKETIPQIHIFRPSLLLGKRDEKRFGERIAQTIAPLFSPFLFGKWRVYKPVQSSEVAAAMLSAAKNQNRGIFIHPYDAIKKLSATVDQHQG